MSRAKRVPVAEEGLREQKDRRKERDEKENKKHGPGGVVGLRPGEETFDSNPKKLVRDHG